MAVVAFAVFDAATGVAVRVGECPAEDVADQVLDGEAFTAVETASVLDIPTQYLVSDGAGGWTIETRPLFSETWGPPAGWDLGSDGSWGAVGPFPSPWDTYAETDNVNVDGANAPNDFTDPYDPWAYFASVPYGGTITLIEPDGVVRTVACSVDSSDPTHNAYADAPANTIYKGHTWAKYLIDKLGEHSWTISRPPYQDLVGTFTPRGTESLDLDDLVAAVRAIYAEKVGLIWVSGSTQAEDLARRNTLDALKLRQGYLSTAERDKRVAIVARLDRLSALTADLAAHEAAIALLADAPAIDAYDVDADWSE